MGLTNMEALACVIPVITYNTSSSKECVVDNCKFFVEKENLSELIKVIELIQKVDKRKYSHSIRERLHMFYDKNDKFLEYAASLYE